MKRLFFAALLAGLAASRLCHVGVLWTEENLPMAAAIQVLGGKTLYRDVWFDKPPLTSLVYLLWGAQAGWLLRVAGALYVFTACILLYRFASRMWSEREGMLAAGLLGFFLTFGIPAAVIPLASDLLMAAPHIAAVYLAWRGRPLWSGALAGVAFLISSKAVFVIAACALWQYRALSQLALGFLIPNAAALGWLWMRGAAGDYFEQVWRLGFLYAGNTFLENPVAAGLRRTVNWMGFHAALAAGAAWYWLRERKPDRLRMALWAALALAGVTAGWRFFPRYYFLLLPVMVLAAARGYLLMPRRRAALLALTLAVPFVRFGPRYVLLARDAVTGRPSEWRDVAMDRDTREAARLISEQARPGDTLFVWGYRPDLYIYTRLPAATRFLESQPLSGVLADRHLFATDSAAPEWARRNREEVVRSRPSFIVDGLGKFNPRLAIEQYADLQPWLAQYERVSETPLSVIYRRR
ncbi:MAG: hypothetical protein ACM3S5_04550 [Rhodospirillales bacterium]